MTAHPPGPHTPGLRILLAHDLSASAELASSFVARRPWPASTVVRVVSSPAGIGPPISSFANLREIRTHDHEVRLAIAAAHERTSAELRAAGLVVESATLRGKPERAIVEEAERFRADVVVVGARGQGAVTAALLGSVSRAVAENARCSVLVVRGHAPDAHRVLLATDGSPPARFATALVASWPMFAEVQVLVLAVGDAPPRSPRAVLGEPASRTAFRDALSASIDRACAIVDEATAELVGSGRGTEVEVDVRLGDVHAEIAATADTWPTDLVVLGAGTEPRLQRLLLGSVARKVLDGVSCSVLVARPPADPGSG